MLTRRLFAAVTRSRGKALSWDIRLTSTLSHLSFAPVTLKSIYFKVLNQNFSRMW
jgi:hypothetical protein